jgi:hypothetical protein
MEVKKKKRGKEIKTNQRQTGLWNFNSTISTFEKSISSSIINHYQVQRIESASIYKVYTVLQLYSSSPTISVPERKKI